MVVCLFRNQVVGVRFPVAARIVLWSDDSKLPTSQVIPGECLFGSMVERNLGKIEVVGPIPTRGSPAPAFAGALYSKEYYGPKL